MVKIKLADVKEFLLKRDEKFLFKYKNLTIVSVALLIVLFTIVLLLPSKKPAPSEQAVSTVVENELVLNQDEKDKVLSSDENTDTTEETIAIDTSNSGNTPEFKAPNLTVDNSQSTTDSNNDLQTVEPTDTTDQDSVDLSSSVSNEQSKPDVDVERDLNTQKTLKKVIVLYCDSFSTKNDALEKKATIAFSTGLLSEAVKNNGTYRLKLGPFNTRNEAIDAFKKLDSQELVGECTLENVN